MKATKGSRLENDRPKRNKNAYIFFVLDVRRSVHDANPSMQFAEVTREVTKRWKAQTDAERAVYMRRGAEDRQRYQREVEAFQRKYPGEPLKKQKKPRKPRGPKKPRSAYLYFSNENRPRLHTANPLGLSFGEVTKRLAEEWTKLNEKQKDPYVALALNDKQRYEEELQTYQSTEDNLRRENRSLERRLRKAERRNQVPVGDIVVREDVVISGDLEIRGNLEVAPPLPDQPRHPVVPVELECAVCMDAPKSALLQPCNHLAVCVACGEALNPRVCPICRGPVDNVVPIFLV